MRKFSLFILGQLFCLPAFASYGEPENKLLYKLPTIYSDGFIRVVSDAKISNSEGKAVASIARKAIKFDMDTLGWNDESITKDGYCIAIISRKYGIKTLHSDGFGGEALEPDLFAGGLETYRKDKQRFSVIIAHELAHIIVYRRFAQINPRLLGWSRPWDEGLAQNLEYRFELAMYKDQFPSGRMKARAGDLKLTADDAIWTFEQEKLVARKKGYELSRDNQDRWANCVYPLGRQFIEFIRVHLNGAGCPDAIQKISRVVVKTAKSGRMFEDEFENEFGVKLSSVQEQFVEHLRETQKNPAARFEGTIIEAG